MPKFVRWSLLAIASGSLAGFAASFFLWLLKIATETRELHPQIIWGLPCAGFFIAWVYLKFGRDIAAGNTLVFQEIHDPKKVIPLAMAPFILLGTVITHLFGGSAGREGTAVQMGASLSDQLAKVFDVENQERKILLTIGVGAGFGAAIGAPWAGVFFGMEVVRTGKLKPFAVVESFIASFTAYFVTRILHAPHSVYPAVTIPDFTLVTLAWTAIAGVIFGLAAFLFIELTHAVERLQRLVKYPPLKTFMAGLVLVIAYEALGTNRYAGLGISVIQEALTKVATFTDPCLKAGFTAITIGSGFKGGEFIPLVFIGTTLGSALSVVIPVSFSLLGAVGFAAVFAGASNTPIACSIMAFEIFGPRIAPYAIAACFLSYLCSGPKSIYPSQKMEAPKYSKLRFF